MTYGAPLAPMRFPATDSPSAIFLTRFERALRALPDDMLGTPFSIGFASIAANDFATCIESIGAVSSYVVVALDGAHGLVAIPDAMIHPIAEFAYGGDSSDAAATSPAPTRLEARLVFQMASAFVHAVASTCPDTELQVLGATDTPGEAVPLNGQALAIVFTLRAHDVAIGTISALLPLRALAAVENASAGTTTDDDWTSRLEVALASTRIDVRCVLARPTLAAGEVARLVPGAVIPIDSLSEVALIAGGYRIASGTADAHDGRAAISINRTEFQL